LVDSLIWVVEDAVYKFLDTTGNKLDYRHYSEVLLKILIAGGLLAHGGSIKQDGEKGIQTRACVFQDVVDLEKVKACDQVFIKLMLRYKYLEKMLPELMRKILVFLRGFTQVKM
jgi:hypothetical protein